jgi:hypothetical protein
MFFYLLSAETSRERFNQRHGRDRPAEHPEHRSPPDLVPRRQLRELHLDEVEIVLKPVEIAAELIGLAQRERALVWH